MWIAARQDHARAFMGSSRVAVSRSRIAPEKSWLYCLRIARITRTSSGGAGRAPPGFRAALAEPPERGAPSQGANAKKRSAGRAPGFPLRGVGGTAGRQLRTPGADAT